MAYPGASPRRKGLSWSCDFCRGAYADGKFEHDISCPNNPTNIPDKMPLGEVVDWTGGSTYELKP